MDISSTWGRSYTTVLGAVLTVGTGILQSSSRLFVGWLCRGSVVRDIHSPSGSLQKSGAPI